MTTFKRERLLYIDNLRLMVIFFVVVMHLAVTYSGFGSWYNKEGASIDIIQSFLFGFYQAFTQGYFMGFLFLISGYFIPSAYDRKGFAKFLKDRSIRLGIPTLLYMLIINPFILYVLLDLSWVKPKPGFISFYADYVCSLDFINGSGPLWFAFALLIFTCIYGISRFTMERCHFSIKLKTPEPTLSNLFILILLISACAFLIRLVQPIGTNFHNMQLGYFSQYVILFIIGIIGCRNNWFSTIPYKTGKKWLISGLIAGFTVWTILMLTGGAVNGNMDAYNGGFYWQSIAFSLWESFVAVAMSVGLITFFREKCNKKNNLIKKLSDSAFAVYVFHPPVIIVLTMWFKPIAFAPIFKFIIMCVVCIPLCFALAHFILRRIPLLKKVL